MNASIPAIPVGHQNPKRRLMISLTALLFLAICGNAARAGQVDNPEYKAWAKFKVGSTRTLSGSSARGFRSGVINDKEALAGIKDDKVLIAHPNDLVQGDPSPLQAKTDEKNIKYIAEESVEAMGKTFKCKVYEVSRYLDWNLSSLIAAKSKLTKIWMSDEVPGGVVKLETHIEEPGASQGQVWKRTETFLLTAYEAK